MNTVQQRSATRTEDVPSRRLGSIGPVLLMSTVLYLLSTHCRQRYVLVLHLTECNALLLRCASVQLVYLVISPITFASLLVPWRRAEKPCAAASEGHNLCPIRSVNWRFRHTVSSRIVEL